MVNAPHARSGQTKIVATVGPASDPLERLTALVQAGVDVFRLNTAHGERADHQGRLDRIREVSRTLNQPVGVLIDLAGPKMRLGELAGGQLQCLPDQRLRFIHGRAPTLPTELTTTYEPLIDELAVGDRVMLADGTVSLVVEAKGADYAECRVVQPGLVRSRQGVNLPGVKLSATALSDVAIPDRLTEENVIWVTLKEPAEPRLIPVTTVWLAEAFTRLTPLKVAWFTVVLI